jgi:hypothetical protein
MAASEPSAQWATGQHNRNCSEFGKRTMPCNESDDGRFSKCPSFVNLIRAVNRHDVRWRRTSEIRNEMLLIPSDFFAV